MNLLQSQLITPPSEALEDDYQAARIRLLAAQQEKAEATIEFLAVREALRSNMAMLWPGQEG